MADEEETYKQFEIKEGIIFLVELSLAILQPINDLDGRSQLLEILSCVNELMSDMVMTYPKNGVGIYFYNCQETSKKFPKNSGLSKVFSLNDLNSSNMKKLTEIVRDDIDGFKSLQNRFKYNEEPQDRLHTILKTILREFQVKTQYNVKKLFWLTNNDKPYINKELKDSLRTMISDFEDNKIWVNPIFLDSFEDRDQTKRKSFDISLYQNIFLNTNFLSEVNKHHDEDDLPLKKMKAEELDTPVWLDTLVSSHIRKSISRLKEIRRIQFSCDLIMSDGDGIGGRFGCSIKGYTLFNHESVKLFRQVYTGGDTLKLVQIDSKVQRQDSAQEVDLKQEEKPEDQKENLTVVKGIPVKRTNEPVDGPNEKIIYVTEENLEFMRTYAFDNAPGDSEENVEDEKDLVSFSRAPYLKLLCFRPISSYKPYFNLKAPLFVTADLNDGLGSTNREGGYTNSLITLKHLYQGCVKLERYAVVFGCIKKNSTPNLYALYPTNIKGSSSNLADRVFPEGFLLIQLPWLNEVRSLPDYMFQEGEKYFTKPEDDIVPEPLLELYKSLIEQVGIEENYDPSEHPNPVLNHFYKVIKQEALQIDIKNELTALEDNDWSSRKLIDLRKQLEKNNDTASLLRLINSSLNKVGNEDIKRKAAEDNLSPQKKPKPEKLTEQEVILMWKNNSWKHATVAQLKDFISRYDKIKSATRKADMVDNISQFLEERK
ncbi:hypothetical protein C7M61_002528 [Candidozyma pseudohaemuli]|uniref:ATP-dependent DNA helicase II subunit 1 n=1 Tax=Candidozyma pseudohaemuli TaxID=418784 RepID=A0A2P7YRL1_9ASCO|nr:hypothetical protein C7M61_002528 [[Candida] pseudohaemulonii]PSK38593.1 hypothetical protein C7M61_002528 [[Candida] pseudohaemulonii]